MKRFNEEDAKKAMKEKKLKGWTFHEDGIEKGFTFKNFVQAFSFMTAGAIWAEKQAHHPDWSNVYNKVEIRLTTHDCKGLTEKDFALAEKFDKEYKHYES